jgi:integrase
MAAKLEKTRTPGVYRRGKSYVVVYRHQGQQRKRHARTYDEARALKATLTADIRRGEHREASNLTFEQYAREWIDSYQGRTTRGFRDSTRVGYRRSIEKAIPFFSKRTATLTSIEPGDVRAFIVWLFEQRTRRRVDGKTVEVPLAVSTVRGHVAAVKVLLATAVEDDLIRHNPASGVRVTRSETPVLELDTAEQRRALDSDELARFLTACPEEWEPFFRLLAMTGLRISEAIELRWRDVDFGAKRLRVRRQSYEGVVAPPKSKYGKRDIPLSTAMTQLLWPRQSEPDALVFVGPRGERVDRAWLWRQQLEPARDAAGVPWATFHTFRHTCASILFAEGRNPKQVQLWLGHSDPGFTLRVYVHLIDDGLGDADFLDDAAWATPGATRATDEQANADPHEPRKTA